MAGLIATAFDYFDSRAGDPHLHTHVVIANKARTSVDEQGRSLEGRPFHASVVAMSEFNEALFADRLTGLLGVEWEPRAQGRDRNPSWAIISVPERLIEAFSSRSRDIDGETDRLINAYVASHGHRPAPAAVIRLRGQATLSTRPEKQIRSLPNLTAKWRERAEMVLGVDPVGWASRAVGGVGPGALRAGDVKAGLVAQWGDHVVAVVGEKRSTWRHWNLVAEAARQTMGWRFATPSDREEVTAAIVTAAEHASVRLTPSELASTPERFCRKLRPRCRRVGGTKDPGGRPLLPRVGARRFRAAPVWTGHRTLPPAACSGLVPIERCAHHREFDKIHVENAGLVRNSRDEGVFAA